MPKKKIIEKFTPYHAGLICEVDDIDSLLDDEYEVELLEEQNPELLEAYRCLVAFADSEE